MAVALIGGVCVVAIGFLIFMSIVGGVIRMFRGGGYSSGGYREPRHGWGWGQSHQQGWGTHKPMPHHPKPSGGGGFKMMFGSSGGSSHKPSRSHSSKSNFGGGGAKKKW